SSGSSRESSVIGSSAPASSSPSAFFSASSTGAAFSSGVLFGEPCCSRRLVAVCSPSVGAGVVGSACGGVAVWASISGGIIHFLHHCGKGSGINFNHVRHKLLPDILLAAQETGLVRIRPKRVLHYDGAGKYGPQVSPALEGLVKLANRLVPMKSVPPQSIPILL